MSDTTPLADAQRKRKRLSSSDDAARPNPPLGELRSSQNPAGVYVDIPPPSSSALAALHATQLPSSQFESQTSLPASLFDDLASQPTPQRNEPSGSEYIPSSTHDDPSSSSLAAVVGEGGLRRLPSISTAVFEPFLDDTTGMALEQAEARIAERRHEQNSSPVESFSPAEPPRPENVPRIGAWILPELNEENSHPNAPDYTSQEVLSQKPFPFPDEDDENDDDARRRNIARSGEVGSQPSPGRRRMAREEAMPLQSTPAIAPQEVEVNRDEPPSQPIPSQQLESTPALPPTAAPRKDVEPPPSHEQSSGSNGSSASLGWSTLPRAEVVELVHRSPHIPSFLKDEIERFVLRASRSASQSRQRGSQGRRSHSHSQSQSQSQDDSETQEDGFLRTKKVWCMDLLLFPARASPTALAELGVASQVLQRLTQASQLSESGGGVAILLLLDTVQGTFDVHELDESLAAVLRADRRYSVQFDADGRRWTHITTPTPSATTTTTATATTSVGGSGGGGGEEVQAELSRLQRALEASAAENETLGVRCRQLQREVEEARTQHDFVRTLYDRASASASTAQSSAAEAETRVAVLEGQLRDGLALHRSALDNAVGRWKQQIKQLEAERAFLREQQTMTDGVREKAALWDAYQAEERDRERTREQRIKANEEKRRQLAAQLGTTSSAPDEDGLGPFARPLPGGGVREESPVDEMDELAALAREAAEAGDPLPSEGAGRSRRSRRPVSDAAVGGGLSARNASNRPPPSAAEVAAHVEAAALSSTHAQQDSRLELEDQFAIFSNTPQPPPDTTEDSANGMGTFGIVGDFDAAPSTGLSRELFDAAEGERQGGEEGEQGWGSLGSTDVPPAFTQSLVLNSSDEHDSSTSFHPHTQA